MISLILQTLNLVLLASIWGALNRIGSRLYETNDHLASIQYRLSPTGQTGDPDTATLERTN